MPRRTQYLHGVFLEVLEIGVLLEGPAGIGKSALALELISRGHRLVADDAPLFARCGDSATVTGSSPPELRNLLEVYGLGVLNIAAMFGNHATRESCPLQLAVSLVPGKHYRPGGEERLRGSWQTRSVLGVEIPLFRLPVIAQRNLAVMLEGVVRNYLLRLRGEDAAGQFIAARRAALGEER
ncbi:MAG TPA: hypothetical protein ENJ43_06545 [Gammaproteobacteria bacterium]|nr:hypothetical protein [Gammaproteobacteria bacterium]